MTTTLPRPPKNKGIEIIEVTGQDIEACEPDSPER